MLRGGREAPACSGKIGLYHITIGTINARKAPYTLKGGAGAPTRALEQVLRDRLVRGIPVCGLEILYEYVFM